MRNEWNSYYTKYSKQMSYLSCRRRRRRLLQHDFYAFAALASFNCISICHSHWVNSVKLSSDLVACRLSKAIYSYAPYLSHRVACAVAFRSRYIDIDSIRFEHNFYVADEIPHSAYLSPYLLYDEMRMYLRIIAAGCLCSSSTYLTLIVTASTWQVQLISGLSAKM